MSCSNCFEWLVEILTRNQDSIYNDPDVHSNSKKSGGITNKEDKRSKPSDGGGNDEIPTYETSSLSTFDKNEFKRERMKQLFNKHGYNLAIFPGGHVKGVREAFNLHSVIEIIPTSSLGECVLRGLETGRFLGMNENGKLYGEKNPESSNIVFVQSTAGPYVLYLSKKYSHLGWYVGLKKNGDVKNGRLTWYPWGQKAVLFTHRKPYVEHHPLKQLRNRHSFTLIVLEDGTVRGIKDEEGFSKYSVLEFNSTEPPGAFRIRGVESDLYLAMNKKGRLYGEKDRYNDNTIFAEHTQGRYFIYLSIRWSQSGWHLGITQSGKAKNGKKTVFPAQQKAIQFEQRFPFPTEGDFEEMNDYQSNRLTKSLGEDNFPPLAFIDEEEA